MHVRVIEPIQKKESSRKRVCAYARVSTEHEKQNESLENQMQYYENIISSNPEYQYIGVFGDRGITGYTDKRPEFRRMLEFCEEGKIDLIITKSISRFARNTTVMLETVRNLKRMGIAVLFEEENINTLSGDGELMLTVLSAFAQEESRNVSENLKWRSRKMFEEGKLMINTTRFLGYDKDEYGDLVINNEQAKVVRRIFIEYLKGKGSYAIARELNEENITTVTKSKWCDTTVLGILKNEKYKGDAILQKYYTPENVKKRSIKNNGEINSYYVSENHIPIVSPEMWEEVQKEIERRGKGKGIDLEDTKKYTNRYPLTGMLYCSKCGATLRRRTWNSRNSSRKVVWQCSNYIRNGKDACSGTSIDDEIISRLNIDEETIVKEEFKDGKKCYIYTSKKGTNKYQRKSAFDKKEDGSILQSIHRSIGATF